MKIKQTDAGAAVIHNNGREIACESLTEAREVCHLFLDMKKLFLPKRERPRSVPHGHVFREGGIEKKKVRILIDPDAEIIRDRA